MKYTSAASVFLTERLVGEINITLVWEKYRGDGAQTGVKAKKEDGKK